MKVGLVGVGGWGKNLLRTLAEWDVLGGIAEIDPAKRKILEEAYPHIPIHANYPALFTPDISAIAIATPAGTHFSLARLALLAGKDLFVEKPLTLSVEESETLVTLAKEKDRILMVGHMLLYSPAIQWIKFFLEDGKLGKLFSLHHERLSLGNANRTENVLWDLGVHDVAVLLYLVDSPLLHIKVEGHGALRAQIEEDIYLHLRFKNKVRAHLHTSWLWPEKSRKLTIVGEKGMLTYNEIAQTVTHYRRHINAELVHQDEGSEIVFSQTGEPLRFELDYFLRRLIDRGRPRSDGKSAVEVVRLLTQAMNTKEMA